MDENRVVNAIVIVLAVIMFLIGPVRFSNVVLDVLNKGVIETVKEKMPESDGTGSFGAKFKPHIIPLSIAFDSRAGIVLSCEGKIPTPIGTFEIYKNVTFPKKKTLTIVLRDKKYVYDLGDRSFNVSLPNDLHGKSKVEYDGNGNIFVVVPNPA